jgi:hypothetical protein
VVVLWLVLVVVMVLLARKNLSVPGLYYDEAVFAGMTKDFLTGQIHGQHMPGSEVAQIFGRPFPVFVQSYLGALKCWMLVPGFQLFGHTVAVLRGSNLFWSCLSLLLFMLGTWRWLGLRPALIAGTLLALDPAYFFLGILDWGVAVPSFLCRCAAFFLAVVWWRRRQAFYVFLAAFFAGLGFFNKIDFAVLLAAVFVAGFACFGRTLWTSLTAPVSPLAFAAAGFLAGAGAILLKVPLILRGSLSGANPSAPGELGEKVHTMLALYDGSYFYRLLDVGGVFERMYSEPAGWLPLFGLVLLAAALVCVVMRVRSRSNVARIGLFLVVAGILTTFGVMVLPGAVRIHHAVLVYPLPQLIIAFAATGLMQRSSEAKDRAVMGRVATWVVLLGVLLGQVFAIYRTQELVRVTGGRGRWSERFDAFCREIKDRTDLTVVSLDWGFNEQLNFLTDRPQLAEPFWRFGSNPPPLSPEPRYLYLVHPPEYSLFPFSEYYLKEAQGKGSEVEVRPYSDRQGRVAFYTIQYLAR